MDILILAADLWGQGKTLDGFNAFGKLVVQGHLR
jgi:hypothetical protein